MAKRKKQQKPDDGLRKRTVENPAWEPAREGEKAFPRFIEATVNTRESATETLFSRGLLGEAQKKAADHFRAIWEKAGGKSASLDYSADRVDGGKGDPLVTKLTAAFELQRCRNLLGQRGYENVEAVCGEGKALTELTPHKRERLTMADNLRADLDDLATMWGLQTRRNRAA